MATAQHITVGPAPQPGLRSFIVYDELPSGCIEHFVANNDAEPHVRAGESAVVDPCDREPVAGEIYLVQWQSSGRRALYELQPCSWADGCWSICPLRAQVPVSLDGTEHKPILMVDGPYPPDYLAEKIVGKVVGILSEQTL